MLFLHISIASVRMMNTYTKMIRDHFPLEEHRFIYLDKMAEGDRELLEYGNSEEIAGGNILQRLKRITRELDAADVIIWHGLIFGTKRVMLAMRKKYRKKSVWIIRGIDLYNWKKLGKSPKDFICNVINRRCRRLMPNVGIIFETDSPVFEKSFGTRAKQFFVPYPLSGDAFEEMEKFRDSLPRDNGKVYIQVNHNAYTFNRHLEVLDSIQPYADENIRVIVPLSYGNDWHNSEDGYVQKVVQAATTYFEDKAVCLRRLMAPDKYTRLLCNVDVSIYGAARQNGLGNILRSLYLGNKVFLSEENPLYGLLKSKDIEIFRTEDIPDMSYEEFIKPPAATNAVNWIRRNNHPEAAVYYWQAMFNSFKGEPTDSRTVEAEIDKALESVFPEDGARTVRPKKLNYVSLSRYGSLPKGTRLSNIAEEDILIIGAGTYGQEIYQQLEKLNLTSFRWDIIGFADKYIKTLDGQVGECDVITTPDDLEVREDCSYVIALEDMDERLRMLDYLQEHGANLLYVPSPDNTVYPYSHVGEGVVIMGDTVLAGSAIVEDGVMIKSSFIDSDVRIGRCSVIESKCTIYAGAVIGEGTLIGVGCQIGPDVRIGDHKVIPPLSVVTEDIL